MDIADYLVNPSPDGKEWLKRKVLATKWELRRTIEELEFIAKQYQLKKKYDAKEDELAKLEENLMELLELSQALAVQIRNLA